MNFLDTRQPHLGVNAHTVNVPAAMTSEVVMIEAVVPIKAVISRVKRSPSCLHWKWSTFPVGRHSYHTEFGRFCLLLASVLQPIAGALPLLILEGSTTPETMAA